VNAVDAVVYVVAVDVAVVIDVVVADVVDVVVVAIVAAVNLSQPGEVFVAADAS